VARRALAEQNASLACFEFVVSLARSRALIASFKEGRAPLRPLGRRDLVSIVERQGSREVAVQRQGLEEGKAGLSLKWAPSVYWIDPCHLRELANLKAGICALPCLHRLKTPTAKVPEL
jgi:hypothetical protein